MSLVPRREVSFLAVESVVLGGPVASKLESKPQQQQKVPLDMVSIVVMVQNSLSL